MAPRWLLLMIPVAIVLSVAVSCVVSENDSGPPALSVVSLGLSDSLTIPDDIAAIDLYVSGNGIPDIHEQIQTKDLVPGQDAVFEVELKSGEDRVFFMTATNDNGDVAYEGRETVDLSPGRNALTLELYGQGYIFGKVYWINPETLEPGDPLADHDEVTGDIIFATDSKGRFEIKLPTRTNFYQVEVHTTGEPFGKAHTPYYAFVLVEVAEPGQRTEVDLTLIPEQDDSRPWICAVTPKPARIKQDKFQLFGRGFIPEPGMRPIAVVFDPGTNEIYDQNPTIHDDTRMSVSVPFSSAQTGQVSVRWLGGEISSNLALYEAVN